MPTKLSRWDHPAYNTLLPALIGLVLGGGLIAVFAPFNVEMKTELKEADSTATWLLLRRTLGNPGLAFLIGVGVGIPAAWIEKRQLRRNFEHYVTIAMAPDVQRNTIVNRLRGIWVWLPTLAALFLAALIAWLLRMSVFTAPLGVLVPLVLTYPEERRIYRAAKERIAKFTAG